MTEYLCDIYRNMTRKITQIDSLLGGSVTIFDDEISDILAAICLSIDIEFDDFVYDVMYDYALGSRSFEECIDEMKERGRLCREWRKSNG